MNADLQLQNYLAAVTKEMKGLVPAPAVDSFVSETGFWIERIARESIFDGLTLDEATAVAIHKHGKAKNVAREYIEKFYEDEIDSPVYKKMGRANTTAVAVFGMVNVFYMVFLQVKTFIPSGERLQLSMSPAEARQYFPAPLPFPDLSWQFIVTVAYPLIAPLIAGIICGRLIPVGAAHAVYRVLLLMTLGVFLLGATLLPQLDGIIYACLLTLYWLPMGCLTAHFSSSLARWQHRRAAERTGAHPSRSTSIQEVHPL